MAVRAGSVVFRISLWRLLTEASPGRLAYAGRLALICTLTAIFAEIYKTPDIALTIYIAFFLNKPERTSSVLTTVALTLIVTIIIGMIFLVAEPVLASPALRVLTMTVISFVMLFLASASKLKPIASVVALVVVYALDLLGSIPVGELATRGLLYAWLFVGIPGFVSLVMNLLIAPSPRHLAQQEIAERLRAAAEALPDSLTARVEETAPPVFLGDDEIQEHLKLATLERTSSDQDVGALKGCSDCIVPVLSAVQLMLDNPAAMPPKEVRQRIRALLEELASIFQTGGYPARVDPVPVDSSCTELAVSAVEFLNTGLTHLGDARPVAMAANREEASGFFVPDAFTNPVHVQFAIKTTGAAMLCYLTYSILSWPGIHTALITCFIVGLSTAAESVEKLTLRIVGCLVGAGLGLLVLIRVIPVVTGVGGLAAIVFVGAFLGAWIAAGDKHIAYAGFQVAFAYLLCVIQGPAPSFDMVVARDRVIGILLGNVVSYFVATRVWPVSVGPRINGALQSAKEALRRVAKTIDASSRRRSAAETQSILEAITSDIRLTAYEPTWIRPGRACLMAQQLAVEAMRNLTPPVLAFAELAPESLKERLCAAIDSANAAEPLPEPSMSPAPNALAALEALLRLRINGLQQAMFNLNKVEQDA